MRMSDEEAFEHYRDPDNRAPTGETYQVPKSVLTRHVPIRFRPQTIANAKVIAERDGMTVSSWIRGVVEREVERRMPDSSQTQRSGPEVTLRIIHSEGSAPQVETQNDSAQRQSA